MAMARMDDIRDETPAGETTGSQPAGSADKGPRSVGPERETRGGPKAPDTAPDEAERQHAVARQATFVPPDGMPGMRAALPAGSLPGPYLGL